MKSKILFVICLLFGLMFINAGLNKIFNYIPIPEGLPDDLKNMNAAMLEIGWLIPMIAIAEIVGGILIIIPKLRALGALIIFPIMIGIFLVHLLIDQSGLILSIILFAILIWVMIENRAKYLPLIR